MKRYKHGLFKTRYINSTIEKSNNLFKHSQIEWIRNVTYQSPFVAVTTYNHDVIVSAYEYSPISGLRVAGIISKNRVICNHTYDLTPQPSIVVVHKQYELIWFARYSQSTNFSHLIGLLAKKKNGSIQFYNSILY